MWRPNETYVCHFKSLIKPRLVHQSDQALRHLVHTFEVFRETHVQWQWIDSQQRRNQIAKKLLHTHTQESK